MSKGLTLAFWLNLSFSLIEAIGGILTNSTAIVADAFHDFMDAVAIGGAVLLEKVSGRKRSARYSYGYKRFSVLAALGMSILLITGAVLMVITAIRSFAAPQIVNSVGMLGLALLGIAVNGFAFLRIRNGNRSAHGHQANHNSRAIMLHLLEDVLGWVAVLIGAVVIYFTGWYWIDGLLTLAIAGFIAYNAIMNLISTLQVILQSVPSHLNMDELEADLRAIKGIEDIHDLHVWSLDGGYNVCTLHAVVSEGNEVPEDNIHADIVRLLDTYRIQHPTVQFETYSRKCTMTDC